MSSLQSIAPQSSVVSVKPINTQDSPTVPHKKVEVQKNELIRQDSLNALNLVSNVGKGLLIGGVASTIVQAFTTVDLVPALEASPAGFAFGAAIGAGVGLIKTDTQHENANKIKNTVGGALIGGGAAGILAAVGKTFVAAKSTWAGLPSTLFFGLPPVSAKAIGAGAILGAGIALYAYQKK